MKYSERIKIIKQNFIRDFNKIKNPKNVIYCSTCGCPISFDSLELGQSRYMHLSKKIYDVDNHGKTLSEQYYCPECIATNIIFDYDEYRICYDEIMYKFIYFHVNDSCTYLYDSAEVEMLDRKYDFVFKIFHRNICFQDKKMQKRIMEEINFS